MASPGYRLSSHRNPKRQEKKCGVSGSVSIGALGLGPRVKLYPHPMHLITRTEDLAEACPRLCTAFFVTVDTEFMREQTFWPKLCLIQMAANSTEVLVDSLTPGLDLKPFFDLMVNEQALKVFHSARQDIEIVHHLGGVIPHPIFDTQVAAMVRGFPQPLSY